MSETTQGGSNVAIVALIVVAILVAGAAFLYFGGGGGSSDGGNTTVIERTVEKVTPEVSTPEPAPKADESPGLSMSHESDDGQKTTIEANP